MNFCVDGRHSYSVLKQADEIRVAYRDKGILMDYIEKVPDKTIILDIPTEEFENVNINEILMYSEKFSNFYACIHKLEHFLIFANNNINWYWAYPITSFFELRAILKLQPSQILLAAPLTFSLPQVKKLCSDIKIRAVANSAVPKYLIVSMYKDNVAGFWIRPEDVDTYAQYIDTIEFDVNYGDYKKEAILLDVYKSRSWPGNINLLIDNLNRNISNIAIPNDFAEKRIACGQACMVNGVCKYCNNALKVAEDIRKLAYERRKKKDN